MVMDFAVHKVWLAQAELLSGQTGKMFLSGETVTVTGVEVCSMYRI